VEMTVIVVDWDIPSPCITCSAIPGWEWVFVWLNCCSRFALAHVRISCLWKCLCGGHGF
jgi:hypothetical protein